MINPYENKRVIITGSNGFKGRWLARVLQRHGARVYGCPFDITTNLAAAFVDDIEPDITFHFAGVSSAAAAARDPALASKVNVDGTVNIVKACVLVECPVVLASSDCVYYNDGRPGKYAEGDKIGGKDIYSTSKSCAELVALEFGHGNVASVRSALCIGGNDFCKDRLLPSIVESFRSGVPLVVRHPYARRPVLHVLDALRGYLMVGARLLRGERPGEAWNLSPSVLTTVEDILDTAKSLWPKFSYTVDQAEPRLEVVRLDSSKVRTRLGWFNLWDLRMSMLQTLQWYRLFTYGVDYTSTVVETYERGLAENGLDFFGQIW